jgi:6-phospho-beta-glucosidase
MKLAIIGGAGVRVPLLVSGLARSDLRISEIHLYDLDRQRLPFVADLAARLANGVRLVQSTGPEDAIDGARFVICSIRPGGAARRAADEAAALSLGVVGQETVGPVGFAMAIRTIPAMVAYARMAARLAPRAWMISFTNPVSIVLQAVLQEVGAPAIGICDTPLELFEDAAHALGLPPDACAYDYFGLNHLGWLRNVYFEGRPELHRLWDDDARLAAVYRSPLFDADRLRSLRLLPTEYLYYYYRPLDALAHLHGAGTSRGAAVASLTEALFADLARGAGDPVERYRRYLADRDSGYMQLETGSTAPRAKPEWSSLSGYDRIAVMVMRAIVHHLGAVIPLNVANGTTLPFLDRGDVVEVQCRVGRNGPEPEPMDPVPDHARELMLRVKRYERATVAAALGGSREEMIAALALNPLVPSRERAAALVDAVIPA